MPTTDPMVVADDQVVTVTLAGSEISAYGERLLMKLSSTTEVFSSWVPMRWSQWNPDEGEPAAVTSLLDQLAALRQALENREPIDIAVNLDEFRSLLRDGITAARETISTAIEGGFNDHVNAVGELDEAAENLSALISILDRVGWGERELKGLDVLRIVAERMG